MIHSGLIDNSGIKFFITDKLRKYDAGVMEIGLEYTDKMAIPPGLKEWKLNGYCVSKCTETVINIVFFQAFIRIVQEQHIA